MVADEPGLFVNWAFTLDAWAATGPAADTRRLAGAFAAVLDATPDLGRRHYFGLVAEGASRFAEVGGRYLAGHLSRTGWAAFVSAHHWPEAAKPTVLTLDAGALRSRVGALEANDYLRVAALLGSPSGS